MAMGGLLAKCLEDRVDRPDLIVPVPMHWSRRLVRGVNPAEVLVEVVAARLQVRSLRFALRCRRKTRKQGTLVPSERRRNVRGAYRVSAGYVIKGAHILVIDDVMTTGATADEVARVLSAAGAESVSLAVVARGTGVD